MSDTFSQYPERSLQGPLDLSELRELKPVHDFGAIRIPNRPDVSIRLEVEETTGTVIAVSVDVANSSVQFQVFAAARNETLWPEIKESLKNSILEQGGKATEQFGLFGDEVRAELDINNERGQRVSVRHLKFIGIDGPRWILRVMVSGAAITDPGAAGVVEEVIRGVVVNRGEGAMPPRELLPIVMPTGAAATLRNQ